MLRELILVTDSLYDREAMYTNSCKDVITDHWGIQLQASPGEGPPLSTFTTKLSLEKNLWI